MFQQAYLKQLLQQNLLEQLKFFFVPAKMFGTVVPSVLVGTVVSTVIVGTTGPTRLVGTAANKFFCWNNCSLNDC